MNRKKRKKIGFNINSTKKTDSYSLNTPYNEQSYNYRNDNIIDTKGRFVDDSEETKKNDESWIKAPSTSSSASKVTKEEILNEDEIKRTTKIKRNLTGGAIILALYIIIWNREEIFNSSKNIDNYEPKTTTEDSLIEETNYDDALTNNGVTIDEEQGAYDEVLGGKVLAFTDANDDEQVYARAAAINEYLQASNVMDITTEDLCNQIKFINGIYNAATDDEAWDLYNDCLQTFSDYSVATEQSANFAGDVVDDNGVRIALGLDAFLIDNCEHRELMDEVSVEFQNVLAASTMEEKVKASEYLLTLEADLMLGQKETPNGTKLYFHSLTSSEAFITGIMFQIANPIIHSALGENIVVTFKDNVGQDVHVKYETLNEYYNPQCNGEYNTENVWAIVSTDLVETAIAKGLDLKPNR